MSLISSHELTILSFNFKKFGSKFEMIGPADLIAEPDIRSELSAEDHVRLLGRYGKKIPKNTALE